MKCSRLLCPADGEPFGNTGLFALCQPHLVEHAARTLANIEEFKLVRGGPPAAIAETMRPYIAWCVASYGAVPVVKYDA
jgi:hypothetical protein